MIIGPRRCGKNTVVRIRYSNLKYITLDDLDHLERAKRDPKSFVTHLSGSDAIDEKIQRLPILSIAVK